MKKVIRELIPASMEAIEAVFFSEKYKDKAYKTNGIPATFNGYIASFGASTIQMGLLPTIVVFSDKSSSSKENKALLLEVLWQVLQHEKSGFDNSKGKGDLLKTALDLSTKNNIHQLKQPLQRASIAIKLALRTYKLDPNAKDD